jgi:transcription initiation factor TFIID subunit 11
MDTMSMASGVAPSSVKKKKPRKSKGKDNDDASVAGGHGNRASAEGKRRGSRDQTVEEDDEGADEPTLQASAERKAERKNQESRRRVIAKVFDDAQFSRYEAWRASKLPDATVRRVCPSIQIPRAELLMKADRQSNPIPIGTITRHYSSQIGGEDFCWRYD